MYVPTDKHYIRMSHPSLTCMITQWTAVTRDGKRSAQFEETLLVTETGAEVLTAAPAKKSKKKKEPATNGAAAETNGAKEANGDKAAVEEVREKVAETKLEA